VSYVVVYAIGLGLFWAFLVGYTMYALTHPPRKTFAWAISRNKPSDPSQRSEPVAFEQWSFTSRGLSFPVWDMPGQTRSGPIVIFTTGWSDSRLGALDRLDAFLPWASRIIAWDMPGHGDSPGICTLGAKEANDLLRLIQIISEQDDSPIVLYGWSLGAGVSIEAAARTDVPIAAVIGEAPYQWPWTPARSVLRLRNLPWRSNLRPALALLGLAFLGDPFWKRFDRVALAARLTCPLLILHSEHDEICPVNDGRAIAANASAHLFVELHACTHNDLWSSPDRETANEAVAAFLQDITPCSDT